MKKRIAEKFYIEFDNVEIAMSTRISITKKEYDKQIEFLFNQTEQEPDNDGYKVELIRVDIIDKGTYELDFTCFSCGSAFTRLYRYTAKDGYTFKSRD